MSSYHSIPYRTYAVSHPADTSHWQAKWCPHSHLLNSAFLKGGTALTPCHRCTSTSTCRLQYPCASTSSCSSPRCCWRCHGRRQSPRLLPPRKVGDACAPACAPARSRAVVGLHGWRPCCTRARDPGRDGTCRGNSSRRISSAGKQIGESCKTYRAQPLTASCTCVYVWQRKRVR
jgi:hypothetical protein